MDWETDSEKPRESDLLNNRLFVIWTPWFQDSSDDEASDGEVEAEVETEEEQEEAMSEDEQEEEVVEGEGLRPYFVSRVSFAYQKIYKGLTICQTDGTKYVLGRP